MRKALIEWHWGSLERLSICGKLRKWNGLGNLFNLHTGISSSAFYCWEFHLASLNKRDRFVSRVNQLMCSEKISSVIAYCHSVWNWHNFSQSMHIFLKEIHSCCSQYKKSKICWLHFMCQAIKIQQFPAYPPKNYKSPGRRVSMSSPGRVDWWQRTGFPVSRETGLQL